MPRIIDWMCMFACVAQVAVGCKGERGGVNQVQSRHSDQEPSDNDTSDITKESTVHVPDPRLPGLPSLREETRSPGDEKLYHQLQSEVKRKGSGYQARTHHLDSTNRPLYINRLIFESSPYLMQHAHNPVNWYPWVDEAFVRAKQENKPVLLSIGYSTCHWCHVMERESFENLEIATYINENYVAIKVDREERPDVDDVYMTAVQMLTGRGGWPMTLILTPERKPFFAGTYFPPKDGVHGRTGFLTILNRMLKQFRDHPDDVVDRAQKISQRIADSAESLRTEQLPGPSVIEGAVATLKRTHDPQWGGFGRAPKFPRPVNLELLMRWSQRNDDAEALEIAITTLRKMIDGGIHDHIAGGFHRYSTDKQWLVPHFEKMLYDNAQLVCVLLEAYQLSHREEFADTARRILDYLDREMSDPLGGFYSATDADSLNPNTKHEEEGWYFTWTDSEIDRMLGAELSKQVQAYYATSEGGNFEGRNILHTPRSVESVAQSLKIRSSELSANLKIAREKLYQERTKRPSPLRDEKVLASWNGLALSAFSRAAFVLDDSKYLNRSRRLATFLNEKMRDKSGRMLRRFHHGNTGGVGFLDDHAFAIQGLLDLFSADSHPKWISIARSLQEQLDKFFLDEKNGGYYMTSSDAERLLSRQKPDYDGAEPSGNSVAIQNLLRLYEWTGHKPYRDRAEKNLKWLGARLQHRPTAVPKALAALDYAFAKPLQIYVVQSTAFKEGESNQHSVDSKSSQRDSYSAIRDVLRSLYLPNSIQTIVAESQIAALMAAVPSIEGKKALSGKTTAYVCQNQLCKQPTSDPGQLRKQIKHLQNSTNN